MNNKERSMTECAVKIITTVEDIGKDSCAVVHRTSRAHLIWLGVVFLVLTMLWLETRDASLTSYNFMIGGDNTSVGAEVWIDGKRAGRMTAATPRELTGALFYIHLGNGHHKVELRKPDFKTFLSEIDMQTEGYLSAYLQPSSQ